MQKAISYLRFSDLLQARGDSKRRQSDETLAYAAANRLEIVDTYEDFGMSAFRGRNATAGALAALIHMARSGVLQALDIRHVIVEGFDRLSRMDVDEAYDLFRDLIRTGLTIHTTKDRRVYDRQSLKDPLYLMGSIMIMARANEESATKSYRLKARREQNRIDARNGLKAMTKVCPAWLRWDDDFEWNGRKGWFKPIPERVETVRRIGEMAANGTSAYFIVRLLTETNVPTFGAAKNGWSTSYVSKLLRSETVLGTMQPRKLVDGKFLPDGDPIVGYYPPVMTPELFRRVQLGKRARNTKMGRTGTAFTNLFKGVLHCACCSNGKAQVTMHIRPCIRRGKVYNYLICSGKRKAQRHPVQKNFNYDTFERLVLDYIQDLDLSRVVTPDADDGSAALRAEIADLSYRVSNLHREQETLAKQLDRAPDDRTADFVMKRIAAKLEEIDAVQRRLDTCTDELKKHEFTAQKRAKSQEAVVELKDAMLTADVHELYLIRERLSFALLSMIDDARFDPSTGDIDVIIHGGVRALRFRDGELVGSVDLVPGVIAEIIPVDAFPVPAKRQSGLRKMIAKANASDPLTEDQ